MGQRPLHRALPAARLRNSRSADIPGPGIPAQRHRAASSRRSKRGGALGYRSRQTGTGLGLTISRLLAGRDGAATSRSRAMVGFGSNLPGQDPAVGGSTKSDAPTRRSKPRSPAYPRAAQDHPWSPTTIPCSADLLRDGAGRPPLGFILLSAPDGPGPVSRLCPSIAGRTCFLPPTSRCRAWMAGKVAEDAAQQRPPPGPHPDGVRRARLGSPWHAAGAALP